MKLFLICPECNIEHALRAQFGDDIYCMTSLGAVFDISSFANAEEANQMIAKETITKIFVVNDVECKFIRNTIYEDKYNWTVAESVLEIIHQENAAEFAPMDPTQQQKLLAKLNIQRQVRDLLEVAFIGNKIRDNYLKVTGLIYDRKDASFEKLEFQF